MTLRLAQDCFAWASALSKWEIEYSIMIGYWSSRGKGRLPKGTVPMSIQLDGFSMNLLTGFACVFLWLVLKIITSEYAIFKCQYRRVCSDQRWSLVISKYVEFINHSITHDPLTLLWLRSLGILTLTVGKRGLSYFVPVCRCSLHFPSSRQTNPIKQACQRKLLKWNSWQEASFNIFCFLLSWKC